MPPSVAMRIAGSAALPVLVVLFFDGLERVAEALDIDGGPRALAIAVAAFLVSWLPAVSLLRALPRPLRAGLLAGAIVVGAMVVVVAGAVAMHGVDVAILLLPFAAFAIGCGAAAGWLAARL